MRAKYRDDVSHAVNLLLFQQWEQGTVILLPMELALLIAGIHWSNQHWTTKWNKMCGRSLCDVAHALLGIIPLNGLGAEGKQWLRNKLEHVWGKIRLPTITDLALMVHQAASLHGSENITLWKMDLASAFNLMNFDHESTRLLAFELTEGMAALHCTGMFGWTGTPYCFQVVSRVLLDIIRPVIVGLLHMYVDDLMGVSPTGSVPPDMAEAASRIRELLGYPAVAVAKSESGRQMDWIGWYFDLDTMSVSIARKNRLKAVYAFFCDCDLAKPINLGRVERMASLASRYAILHPQMKVFTVALHRFATRFHGNRLKPLSFPSAAATEVHMWRAYLCLLHFDNESFARPVASFVPRPARVLIEYDASLSGFGVGISVRNGDSDSFSLAGFTSLVIPYAVTNDSSFQNTNEFTAILLGLLLVKQSRCVSGAFTFNVIGDNTTSLAWCRKGKTSSDLAQRAMIGFTLLCLDLDARVGGTTHIAGTDNIIYDGLSRGKTWSDLDLPPQLEVSLDPMSVAVRYLQLCNPNHPTLESPTQHCDIAVAFSHLLNDFSQSL